MLSLRFGLCSVTENLLLSLQRRDKGEAANAGANCESWRFAPEIMKSSAKAALGISLRILPPSG